MKEDKTTGRDDGRSKNVGAKQYEVKVHLRGNLRGQLPPPHTHTHTHTHCLYIYVPAALKWNNDEFWETIFFQTHDSDMFFRQKSEQIIGEPRKSMER